MKTLLLFLSPWTALAAPTTTHVTCKDSMNVTFHLIDDRGGIAQAGSELTIVANGVLHTVVDTRIDSVDDQADKITVALTTIDRNGVSDDASGKATLELARKGKRLTGAGTLKIQKAPPSLPDNLVLREEIALESCRGSL